MSALEKSGYWINNSLRRDNAVLVLISWQKSVHWDHNVKYVFLWTSFRAQTSALSLTLYLEINILSWSSVPKPSEFVFWEFSSRWHSSDPCFWLLPNDLLLPSDLHCYTTSALSNLLYFHLTVKISFIHLFSFAARSFNVAKSEAMLRKVTSQISFQSISIACEDKQNAINLI